MAQLLPAMARALHTSSTAAAAAPALATTKSSGGLFSALGFGTSRIDVPLSEPLPATPPVRHSPPGAPSLQTSSLSAGTKVVAVDSVTPVTSLSLVYPAGTAYESGAHVGVSKVLEVMAFKATTNRTTFRLTRELEKMGITTHAKAGRDTMTYTLSAAKLHTPEAVELLLDATLNARLTGWETAEVMSAVRRMLAEAQENPENVVSDALHRAAFDGGLGQPLHMDPSLVDGITADTLREYVAATFSPSKAVIAASGVNMEELKQLANPLVSGGSSAAAATAPASKYVGGSLNVLAPTSPLTYVALAFEATGGASDIKGAAAAAVARTLLDVSRAVLPHATREDAVFRSAKGFSNLYTNSGLVGLVASSAPAQAAQLVDAVVSKVESLTKVGEPQLKLAKQLALGAYKTQLASTAGLVSVAAPQLLYTGKFNPTDFPAAVEALSIADLASYVRKGLAGKPTFVTYGSMSSRVPSLDKVAGRLA